MHDILLARAARRALSDMGTNADWARLDAHAQIHGLADTERFLRDIASLLGSHEPTAAARSVARLLDVVENAATLAKMRAELAAEMGGVL